ncbi:YraN family protein [uncultured Dialister sp.]|uniref:YraN family protein n=1 Tax=uncultured Dialister sp. TaxID=278064 RepID=UPI0025D27DA5|nr:YraN family protein [uncultured Dialister sp.]
MEKTSFGREGEALARSYLENKGYRFLSANFRTAHSEIDLIMDDGGVLVFVEVKSRHNRRYGEPVEAVNPFKQRHIRLGARAYVLKRNITDRRIRFDVVEVMVPREGEPRFLHTRNAF